MALASTILDRAERTLGWDRTSVGVPGLESTNLLTVVNSAVKEYFASFEKSGEPNSILRKETGYAIKADTNLNGAVSSGATSLVLDSSVGWGSTGAVAIWDNDRPDYAKFGANNNTTTLSTVTLVSFAHEDDDVVSLLYALPSDFDGFRSERNFEDGVSVNGVAYYFTSGDPSGRQYAIFDDGTTKFLHFPRGSSGDVFVRYNAAPTVVDGESDNVDIPTKDEDYAMWAVVRYAAPYLERNDMYQVADARMREILNSAHIRKNIGKRPRLRPFRYGSGISRTDIFD